MALQRLQLSECCWTDATGVRSFAGVSAKVYVEVPPLSKPHVAHGTLMRLLPCVGHHVALAVHPPCECFVAVIARKRLFSSVDPFVNEDTVCCGKLHGTHGAGIWLFSSVCPNVHFESGLVAQDPLTDGALVRTLAWYKFFRFVIGRGWFGFERSRIYRTTFFGFVVVIFGLLWRHCVVVSTGGGHDNPLWGTTGTETLNTQCCCGHFLR